MTGTSPGHASSVMKDKGSNCVNVKWRSVPRCEEARFYTLTRVVEKNIHGPLSAYVEVWSFILGELGFNNDGTLTKQNV